MYTLYTHNFNLVPKFIVMARKTDVAHYENTIHTGESETTTPIDQSAVFQAIIIHYKSN